MDQAMVKRGIGAVVLAIIAALLLGYLLKDKSRERQEVVEMKLPGAPDMNIPSLTGSNNFGMNSENGAMPAEISHDSGNSIVASADASGSEQQSTANDTHSTDDPGFFIRPPVNNEVREIQDNSPVKSGSGSAAIAYSTDPVEEVIASHSIEQPKSKPFKPTIIEEKVLEKAASNQQKKPQVSARPKPVSKPSAPAVPKAPVIVKSPVAIGSTPIGKYSIQLLATSSQSRADKLANTMKKEGYKVFITQTQSDDKVLFRVRVGGHQNREEAVKQQDGMKRRYQKNFFVQNSLVVGN